MVLHCVAFGCNNKQVRGNQDLNFHRFPFDRPELLTKWINAIRREGWIPSIYSRLCSSHFVEKDYQIRPGAATKRLRESAVPSIFNFPARPQKPVKERRLPMPGTRCSVAVCNNSLQKTKRFSETADIIYHTFPKPGALRKQWIHLCKRPGKWNPDTCRICSVHFKDDDYERDLKAELLGLTPRKVLKDNAVPSLCLVSFSSESDVLLTRMRSNRKNRRKKLLPVKGSSNSFSTKCDNKFRLIKNVNESGLNPSKTDVNKEKRDEQCEVITVEIEEFVCSNKELVSYEVQVEACVPRRDNSLCNSGETELNNSVTTVQAEMSNKQSCIKKTEGKEMKCRTRQLHIIRVNQDCKSQLSPKHIYDQITLCNVPSSWAVQFTSDKLVCVKLENEVVVLSVTLDSLLNVHFKVHGDELKMCHALYTELSTVKVSSVSHLFKVLEKIDEWTTCRGTTEKFFIDLFLRHPVVKDCKLMYQTMSLHSQMCQQILLASDGSTICVKCKHLKETLTALGKRRKSILVKKNYEKVFLRKYNLSKKYSKPFREKTKVNVN